MTPEQKSESDRVCSIIYQMSMHSKRSIHAASFARSEYLHRYPDDYNMLEMGERIWHLKNYNKNLEIAALAAMGKQPLPPSAAMEQYLRIQRRLFDCGKDAASLIAAYTRAVRQIRALSFSIPEEREKAETEVELMEEAIARLKAELTQKIW